MIVVKVKVKPHGGPCLNSGRKSFENYFCAAILCFDVDEDEIFHSGAEPGSIITNIYNIYMCKAGQGEYECLVCSEHCGCRFFIIIFFGGPQRAVQ